MAALPGDILKTADADTISLIASALASQDRIDILELCLDDGMSISEIRKRLNLAQSSVTEHVKLLERAGLIRSEWVGQRSRRKVCRSVFSGVAFTFNPYSRREDDLHRVDMPVGLYTSVNAGGFNGLASESRVIGRMDDAESFLLPERVTAGILWFGVGWVEYHYPRTWPVGAICDWVEISFEACSEAENSNHEWPSDITVWVNDVELGTWTSPGDFGNRRGYLTPGWWPSYQTQHGLLNTWRITAVGTFLNGKPISGVTLAQAGMAPCIDQGPKLRIGVKPDSVNKRGLNLFGSSFGDYRQGIVLQVHLVGAGTVG